MTNTKLIYPHIITWSVLLLLMLYVSTYNKEFSYNLVVIIFYFGGINIAVFYTNYLVILPRYLISRRYLTGSLIVLALIAFSAVIKYGLASQFREAILVRGENRQYHISASEYLLVAALTSLFFICLSAAVKFSVDWFKNQENEKNLVNEKLTAELAYLKSQINPHFLLNSLNSIYSLAYQKSDKTPEAVLKLSEIMQYMLYENSQQATGLEKEIDHLKSYIDLQRIRFKDSIYIEFSFEADDWQQPIAPLILIAFVENAFKHGIATDSDHPISITMNLKNSKLNFQVKNKKSALNKDETGGIGLHNVRRRLDLLYPDRHVLEITEQGEIYNTKLFLDL